RERPRHDALRGLDPEDMDALAESRQGVSLMTFAAEAVQRTTGQVNDRRFMQSGSRDRETGRPQTQPAVRRVPRNRLAGDDRSRNQTGILAGPLINDLRHTFGVVHTTRAAAGFALVD